MTRKLIDIICKGGASALATGTAVYVLVYDGVNPYIMLAVLINGLAAGWWLQSLARSLWKQKRQPVIEQWVTSRLRLPHTLVAYEETYRKALDVEHARTGGAVEGYVDENGVLYLSSRAGERVITLEELARL